MRGHIENNKENWGIWIIISVFSFFLFYLNHLMPFLPGDDYLYQLKFPEAGYLGTDKITGFVDFIQSQVHHYCNYNYRVAPHFLLQAIFLLPPFLFDVLNSLVFILLPYVILYPFEAVKGRAYWQIYLAVLMFLWIFHFDLGRAYFWTTGSLNYSWFLIPQLYYLGRLYKLNLGKITFGRKDVFVASVICMSNENVSLSLFALSAMLIIKQLYFENKKRNMAFYLSTAILLFGGLAMLLSPSLTGRLSYQGFTFDTRLDWLMEYAQRQSYYLIRYIPVIILIWAFRGRALNFKGSWLFLFVMIVAGFSMMFAPLFEARSAIFGLMVMMMFAISVIKSFDNFNQGVLIVGAALSFFLLMERIPMFKDLHQRSLVNQTILKKHTGSDTTVYLNKYCEASKYSCMICDEVSNDPAYIDNEPIARVYKIHQVALKQEYSVVDKYNSFKTGIDSFLLNSEEKKIRHSFDKRMDLLALHILDSDNKGKSYVFEMQASNIPEDYILIFRGSKRGINRYRFLDILPVSIRLFFLDYLEHHGRMIQYNGNYFAYNHIFNAEDYKYYIVSLYSLNNHRPIGKPLLINTKSMSD